MENLYKGGIIMKSKKRKINIDGFKQKLMDWFLSDEGKEMVEEYEKLPEEEKQVLKKQRRKYIVGTVMLLLITLIVIYNINPNYKEANTSSQNIATVTKTKNEPKAITSGELTKYMIDDLNNIYVKIANTKLGDNVAYSITYNYDIIPQGELSYTKYFVSGELTSVFMRLFFIRYRLFRSFNDFVYILYRHSLKTFAILVLIVFHVIHASVTVSNTSKRSTAPKSPT